VPLLKRLVLFLLVVVLLVFLIGVGVGCRLIQPRGFVGRAMAAVRTAVDSQVYATELEGLQYISNLPWRRLLRESYATWMGR